MSFLNQYVGVAKRTVVPLEFRRGMSERLLLIRESLGLSQKAFAKELGVDRDKYAKWEGARASAIPQHIIPKICEAGGYDAYWFLTGKAPSVSPKNRPSRASGR